ncbi:hypothetical protein BpHYR1_041687 [Brachionus plicatilis]|uniref:Uncharacterized protein n=1 Tax=Brachionus plicatilis TaxID=10195 RepID=A0A3M7Q1W5_BRAPC|nr:hypothetical protein BpHYR1_041687 [Brachionus plicatilis]
MTAFKLNFSFLTPQLYLLVYANEGGKLKQKNLIAKIKLILFNKTKYQTKLDLKFLIFQNFNLKELFLDKDKLIKI